MLFTAAPSTRYSLMKLTLLTHRHKPFALSCFSNNGDGPHWVIHTLAQSPKNPGDSLTWQMARISSTGTVAVSWSLGLVNCGLLGPKAVLGWGGWQERLSLKLVGESLVRSTYSTEPRNGALVTFSGLCVALTYLLFLPKLVKCIMMAWGWKGPCSGAICALRLLN